MQLKKYNNRSGIYHVKNREKYLGKQDPKFKSKLEARMMFYLDHNQSVISWKYEPFPIKYVDKSSNNKIRNYYIDFVATVLGENNKPQTVWIEVKSSNEIRKPRFKKQNINERVSALIWLKNQSKWDAATKLASKYGIKFVIISEKELS